MVTPIITFKSLGIEQKLKSLQEGIANRALPSAVNKTLDQGKTRMGRAITAEFNVKAAYVRERLRIKRAIAKGGVRVEGALIGGKEGGKRSANIIAFLVNKGGRVKVKRGGSLNQLRVKVKKAGAAKELKGAFIGNSGRTVFRRVGKERLPIKPVQVIDVGQMFNTRKINATVVSFMREKFPEVFDREVRFYTERFNRSGR